MSVNANVVVSRPPIGCAGDISSAQTTGWCGIRRFWQWVASGPLIVIARCLHGIRTIGAENVPATGGALLVSNHVSWTDFSPLLASVHRYTRFLIDRCIYNWKPLQWYYRFRGDIPVDVDGHPKETLRSLNEARVALLQGDVVHVYPEGRLTRDGNLQSFKRGFERIARGTGCPIVPVYIAGLWGGPFSYYQGRRPLSFWPKMWRPRVTVVFGRPMRDDATAAEVHARILDLARSYESNNAEVTNTTSDATISGAKIGFREVAGTLITAGTLVTAFAMVSLGFLAWVALAPLLWCCFRVGPKRAALLGFVAGFTAKAGEWCLLPQTTGMLVGAPWPGVGFMALISTIQGVLLGVTMAVVAWVAGRSIVQSRPWMRTPLILFLTPAAWVCFECAVIATMGLFGGVEYPLLEYTQTNWPALTQMAALTGGVGIAFPIVMVNAGIVESVRQRALVPALVGVTVAVLCVVGGQISLTGRDSGANAGAAVRVALLQGNIPTHAKYDPRQISFLAHRYLALCEEANRSAPNLVIWSEGAIPWSMRADDDLTREALRRTKQSGATHLVGCPTEVPETPGALRTSACVVLPDGRVADTYHKSKLLAFAETYVPLPFGGKTEPLLPIDQSLVVGRSLVPVSSPQGRIGVTICSEVGFPSRVRETVRQGADFLVLMGNTAWLPAERTGVWPFQAAVLRAIETGRDIAVVNNVGVSGIVDAFGRVRVRSEWNRSECVTGTVVRRSGLTFYTRYGDVFAMVCAVGLAGFGLATLASVVRGKRDTAFRSV